MEQYPISFYMEKYRGNKRSREVAILKPRVRLTVTRLDNLLDDIVLIRDGLVLADESLQTAAVQGNAHIELRETHSIRLILVIIKTSKIKTAAPSEIKTGAPSEIKTAAIVVGIVQTVIFHQMGELKAEQSGVRDQNLQGHVRLPANNKQILKRGF